MPNLFYAFRQATLVALAYACTITPCAALASHVEDSAAGEVRLHVHSRHGTVTIAAQVAHTWKQRSRGLQGRTLRQDGGMLFLYRRAQPPDAAFWMYRTRIPLDIAFLDAQGRIVAMRHMAPCTSALAASCPRYAPGVAYWSALEVNAGFFVRKGVALGDTVRLADGRAPGALAGGAEGARP